MPHPTLKDYAAAEEGRPPTQFTHLARIHEEMDQLEEELRPLFQAAGLSWSDWAPPGRNEAVNRLHPGLKLVYEGLGDTQDRVAFEVVALRNFRASLEAGGSGAGRPFASAEIGG